MPEFLTIERFLDQARTNTVIDVRAPIEFEQGHVAGAVNVPLFDDEQRAEIGTLYRKQGRQASVLRGLDLVGPKMRTLVESTMQLANEKKVSIHCWRGGMRSRSFAWLIEQADLEPLVLQGGYKAYRKHVLESFKKPLNLIVLSGLTGAGKTLQIQLLQKYGEQVVDLERLANHRGSAFGGIGQGKQPTTEQFENDLFAALGKIDPTKRIWVEDESRSIGSIRIPHHCFEQIRPAPAVFMDVERSTRGKLIADEYGQLSSDELIAAIERITKRMGGQNVKLATEAVAAGNLDRSIELLLEYYDKLYLANKAKMDRDVFVDIAVENPASEATTIRLIELADSLLSQSIEP